MRTLFMNRDGLEEKYLDIRDAYVGTASNKSGSGKSCFYDFAKRESARITGHVPVRKSPFFDSLERWL